MNAFTAPKVLITGASRGIGYATAFHLIDQGFTILAGVRTQEDADRLQAEGSGRIHPLLLDITRPEHRAKAAQAVEALCGAQGLAGLFNNAGIVISGPMEVVPLQDLREQMEVNFVSQVALTQALLPALRKGPGRIIFMSSIAGRSTLPLLGPYSASKYAIEAAADAFRIELAPWKTPVSVIDVGGVQTTIFQTSRKRAENLMHGLPPQARALYDPITAKAFARVDEFKGHRLPPIAVARAVAHALRARRPKARYVIGWEARFRLLFEALPEAAKDWFILKLLQRS
ncbi:MAG: SDR family oxidoreductase [Candidatus Omnitrophica bacterium]|nr:SDR family oxidoreductase [Candidatus Omnitrophota bacterium]